MTLPVAPATKGKSQRSSAYFIDVNTGTTETPVWLRVFGIVSWAPTTSTTLAENTDWDDVDENGLTNTSQVPMSKSWSGELTFSDKDYGTSTYQQDPGQAAIMDADGDLLEIRWYKRNGAGKIRQGLAWVQWNETDNSGLTRTSATLTGDGQLDRETDASTLVTPAP